MSKLTTAAVFTLLTTASLAYAAPAQAQLGIAAGANFAQLSDIDTGDRQATFDNSTGWHLHLWFDLPLGPLALRPGVRYMDVGGLFEDASIGDAHVFRMEGANPQLIEIPVDLRYRFRLPLVTPYVLAGPVLRFPTGSDDEGRFRSFSLAGGAGVGLELSLGGTRLYPELKYTFGITRFTEETYEIGGITISPDQDQHLNAVMLSLGIGF